MDKENERILKLEMTTTVKLLLPPVGRYFVPLTVPYISFNLSCDIVL